MMRSIQYQQGMTLVIALVMLVMMTLFAVSSINLSTVNLRIVGNMQAQKAIDADAQQAIEQLLSNLSNFDTPTTTTISGNIATVTLSKPVCMDSKTASGYSAVVTNVPDDNTWEVVATITDPVTAATTTITQGVEIRQLAGNCPDWTP